MLPNTELARKVQVACDFYTTEEQRPHLAWYYEALMSELKMSDLATDELAAIVAVLTDTNARRLAATNRPEPPGRVFIPVSGRAIPQRRLEAV